MRNFDTDNVREPKLAEKKKLVRKIASEPARARVHCSRNEPSFFIQTISFIRLLSFRSLPDLEIVMEFRIRNGIESLNYAN